MNKNDFTSCVDGYGREDWLESGLPNDEIQGTETTPDKEPESNQSESEPKPRGADGGYWGPIGWMHHIICRTLGAITGTNVYRIR